MELEPLVKCHLEGKASFTGSDLEGPIDITTPSPASTVLDRKAGPGGCRYLRSSENKSEPHSRVGPLAQEALGTISTQETALGVRGDGKSQTWSSVSC